jgi:hypothetical protein
LSNIPDCDLIRESMLRDYPAEEIRKVPMGTSGIDPNVARKLRMADIRSKKTRADGSPSKLEVARRRSRKERRAKVRVSESPQR